MVTRKPVAPTVDTAQAASSSHAAPPYPTTPTADSAKTASSVYSNDLSTSPAFDLIDIDDARTRQRRASDVSSHGTWDSDGTERDEADDYVEVPEPLKIGPSPPNIGQAHEADGTKSADHELPASLRPGPANALGVGSRTQGGKAYEEEAQSNPWQLESNNPYLQQQKSGPSVQSGQSGQGGQNGYAEGSQKAWEQPPAPTYQPTPPPQPNQAPPQPPQQPPAPPVELPTQATPVDAMSKLSLGGTSASGSAATYETAEVLPVPLQGEHPVAPVGHAQSEAFPSTNPWSGGSEDLTPPGPPPKEALSPIHPQQHEYQPLPGPPPNQQREPQYAPPPGPPPGAAGPLISHVEQSHPHPPPPPISTQLPALDPSDTVPETPGAETPGTRDRRQRSEHYQIKHINWFESASGKSGMRQSPILTQNANGPCPLLALVNALVLSTPSGLDTALIETLRTREQVSLGLLLDAVFDELMSGRRGETADKLPDVGDLYAFLLALHTGMNVNPRFITPLSAPRESLDGHASAVNGMHPAHRAQHKPGTFEETREMRLYSTFNVPLIHGWIAPEDTPAYAAFQRSAQSFEDAQNIQFAEMELEDKLRTDGLSFQEQQTLEDIQTIKSFLQTWPTQLTDYGLETISTSLKPGQIAILFRNDHFSTLYKEPRHGALMTLVTDAGYSSHAEIVWESLVDVNGAASEMFSGDFRVVSHNGDARLNQGSSAGGDDGWQTVQSRDRYHRAQQSTSPMTNGTAAGEALPPLPGPRPTSQQAGENLGVPETGVQRTASEQEDHDLALALQLQEEEEDQQRQAEQRRRREQELSERFLSSEERPPAIPPRRGGGAAGRSPRGSRTNIPVTGPGGAGRGRGGGAGPQARPAVNRPAASDDPDAPPSYEQSASDRPYRPAGATAPPTQGNPLNALDALRRQQSAYAQQSSTSVNTMVTPPQHSRRTSQGNRIQRRSSQMNPGLVNQAGPSGPAPAYPGRTNGAATVKDTEDKCVVM